MRLPKYDILLPTLFVAVIFPLGAGGWWRFFSGHADAFLQREPAVVQEVSAPQPVVMASHASVAPVRRHRIAPPKPVSAPVIQEPLLDEPYVYLSDESLN